MVIAVLKFGLGNQLFQYALGRALAERHRTPLLLDVTRFSYIKERDLDLPKLRIRARLLPDPVAKLLSADGGTNRLKTLVKSLASRVCPTRIDREEGYDASVFEGGRGCRLEGYWQSERYFAHLRARLLAELEPKDGLGVELEDFSRRLPAEDSVALHVRRGDLVTNPDYARTIGSLPAAYYAEALERLKARLPGAKVYLFSDDPAWCGKNIPPVLPVEIVSGKVTRSALEDLTIMKRCRHFIIANSTFSWWAAWLGDHPSKQVISPARFFRQPRAMETDLLPAGWETIDAGFENVSSP